MESVNLTIGRFSLLNDIKSLKTCNKSELAQYAGLDRTTIIRNLNALYQAGYIAEAPGANNRNNLIQLTALGESVVAEGTVCWKRAQSEAKAAIGRDNIDRLMKLLTDIESLA
jgi:DNA-binding MarR family transcriptional regulator